MNETITVSKELFSDMLDMVIFRKEELQSFQGALKAYRQTINQDVLVRAMKAWDAAQNEHRRPLSHKQF